MERKKPQPKIDISILGSENTKSLKKPLSQDDLASRDYRSYMDKLNKARETERQEEENGNGSSQTKS